MARELARKAQTRKEEEIEFHNRKNSLDRHSPDYELRYPSTKYYSICRGSSRYVREWLLGRCKDKRVLVYGCGSGDYSFFLAQNGAYVTGIDIADVSIQVARRQARTAGLEERLSFEVMDCEAMDLEDNSVDVIVAAAILHHLDLPKALSEMNRVLRADGEVICVEPLGHNPVIQLYRKYTPELRTSWELEHIFRMEYLRIAEKYFTRVEFKCFHFFTLLAVPFRHMSIFNAVLSAMEMVDSVALNLPAVKRLAWQLVFTLSQPKKLRLL